MKLLIIIMKLWLLQIASLCQFVSVICRNFYVERIIISIANSVSFARYNHMLVRNH